MQLFNVRSTHKQTKLLESKIRRKLKKTLFAIQDSVFEDKQDRTLHHLCAKNQVSPLLYGLNAAYLKQIIQADSDDFSVLNALFKPQDFQHPDFSFTTLHALKIAGHTDLIEAGSGLDLSLETQNPENFEQVKKNYAHAMLWLKQAYPVLYKEMQVMIKTLVVTDHYYFRQGSYSDLLGMLFFHHEIFSRNLVDVYERLIHEVSHMYLFGLSMLDPILLNGQEAKYRNPFKNEPRPLMGVLHAAFVLQRIVIGLEKLDAIHLDPVHLARKHELLDKYKTDLEIAVGELRTHGHFTCKGEALIRSFD